ncbi:IpaD/SipD/SspD family type III secretion system needle tip protein [Xanthomonas albilineans]|uniref:IpaD/SipD/SspD family type III secretion system needle tip protein n=1 Tax=Xanthomonas albilineans TaxID=29447 RepID=UPI0009B9EEFB|nr:IpaD/SipD/SspD family type III secretion system needle tip protein [Xanthomonas albilineans]PPU95091.1 IpaD/SipD/SspD family type III secretion system needle tip protein [Xanthomonas albilineans]
MKPLESMIQRATPTSEPYAMVRATIKSSADAPHTSGANHSDDIAPVQHLQSNGRVSDVLREATRVAVGLLPPDADELRELDMTSLGKAGDIVQRVVNDAATGNAHNLAFALKMQSEARADAISNISVGISNLTASIPTTSVVGYHLGGAASSNLTPSQVDAIVINTLEDLKTFYTQYAKDYATLKTYIAEHGESDPESCEEQLDAFAHRYAKPLYINAGINPAYVSLSLGDTFVVSDVNLPQKGNYQTYSINAASLADLEKREKFIEQLHTDATDAHAIWGAVTRKVTVSLRQAEESLRQLEAASQNTYQVTENLPDNLSFYKITQNADGSYTVKASQKFLDAINVFQNYVNAWKEKDYPPDKSTGVGAAAEELAGLWVAEWGAPGRDTLEQQWVNVIQNGAIIDFDALPVPDPDNVSAEIDSLIRSDAAVYGGLQTVTSNAKAGIIDPYGSLLQEYMQYVQSITDLLSNLSKYVTASGDGTTVNFKADDLKSVINDMLKEGAPFKEWSLTLPGTSSLSASDWKQELSGNFNVTQNADGTTSISLDLSNLESMRDSLSNYSNGDISVTQYNAWYAGFTGQKDNVMNLSQSIAEKFSRMNSEFDNLVQLMSSAISALLESEEKYLQF